MQHLETYISDLLYRYECVTIPHFGAFLTQSSSAEINLQTHTFYPPKKVLAFNEQLKNNDGLLCRYISDLESITFESAAAKIAKHVLLLKKELAEGKILVFNNIGELVLNADKKIEFSPTYQLNYLTDSFGLSEFILPTVTRELTENELEKENTSDIKVKENTLLNKKRTLTPFYKYAVAATIVVGLTGFIGSEYVSNSIESHNHIAQQEADKQLENKIQEATFVINNPLPAVTLTINKRIGKYHVVVGAYREKTNAQEKVKQLRKKGNDAWVEANKHGYYNVVYSSYQKRSEALDALNTIRANYNPTAWLYVKNLD